MHVLSCFPSRRDDVYWPEAKRAALDERYHSDFDHQDCFHNFDHRDQSCYPDHSVDRSATDPAHLMHVFVLVHSLSLFFHPGPFSKSLLNFLQYIASVYVLAFCPRGIWDLSSQIRDQTHTFLHWRGMS